jgi:hypothetical protein
VITLVVKRVDLRWIGTSSLSPAREIVQPLDGLVEALTAAGSA